MPKVFISSEYSGIDHRRGVSGPVGKAPWPGGIFGQRKCPANTYGIFEARYSLPEGVERDIIEGGMVDGRTGRPLPRTALPIARNITGSLPGDPQQIAWGNQDSWRAGDLGYDGGTMPDKTGSAGSMTKGGSSYGDGAVSSKGGSTTRSDDGPVSLPGVTVNRGLVALLIVAVLGYLAFTQE